MYLRELHEGDKFKMLGWPEEYVIIDTTCKLYSYKVLCLSRPQEQMHPNDKEMYLGKSVPVVKLDDN